MTVLQELQKSPASINIIRVSEEIGLTQQDLADATKKSDRTIRRWKREAQLSKTPGLIGNEKLDDLRVIIQTLAETLSEEGIGHWFKARNRYLNNCPAS